MVRGKANSAEAENGGGGGGMEATASTSSGTPTDTDNISTRVGSRTKKAKVVFDPSDNYVPRKRVRKSDLAAEMGSDGATPSSTKLEQVPPKSPVKLEKPVESGSSSSNNNGSTTVAKPRLTLSPVTPQTTTYKPKVLGSGPSVDAGRAATFTPTSPIRNCDMCHKVEQQRRGFKLIDCSICAFRAHSKCLRAHPMYSKFPIQLNFRCFQCIECVVCGKSLRGGKLLFCCDCQNAFHQNCHGPLSESESSSNRPWVCKQCRPRPEKNRSQSPDDDLQPQKPTDAAQPIPDDEAHQDFAGFSDNEIRKNSLSLSDDTPTNDHPPSIKEEVIDENGHDEVVDGAEKLSPRLDSFENVQSWTCDDVYRYFRHHFPEYAHLFKEQEIDGPSLVLMRKSDVLAGFGLKLGPAITLYQRIVAMQNNDPDFRLTWI